MKLTPWFPASVKPVRAGVHEVILSSKARWFRYWNGERWFVGGATPKVALDAFKEYGIFAVVIYPWRGLAEEPK